MTLARLFIFNRDTKCVTPEGLDDFWPEDGREVDMTSAAFRMFSGGKGGKALPTCAPGTLTYEEQVALEGVTHDQFMRFVFPGHDGDPGAHVVPLGGSLPYLLAGVVAVWIAKWRTK